MADAAITHTPLLQCVRSWILGRSTLEITFALVIVVPVVHLTVLLSHSSSKAVKAKCKICYAEFFMKYLELICSDLHRNEQD